VTDDKQPNSALAYDFNAVKIDPPLAAGVPPEADRQLLEALDAFSHHGADSRLALADILEAMARLTEGILPAYADRLCSPVRELIIELRELEAGRAPGQFTTPEMGWQRPPHSLATIHRQARAVVALRWLRLIGCKRGAALKVAQVIRTERLSHNAAQASEQAKKEAKSIEAVSRYFAKDEAAELKRRQQMPPSRRRHDKDGRRADELWEIEHELESALWRDGGRNMADATEREVLDWLRATMRA